MKPGERTPPRVIKEVLRLASSCPRPTNREIREAITLSYQFEISDRTIGRYCDKAGLPTRSIPTKTRPVCANEDRMRALLSILLSSVDLPTPAQLLEILDHSVLSHPFLVHMGKGGTGVFDAKFDQSTFDELFRNWGSRNPVEPDSLAPDFLSSAIGFDTLRMHLANDPLWQRWRDRDQTFRECAFSVIAHAQALSVGMMGHLDDTVVESDFLHSTERIAHRLGREPEYRDRMFPVWQAAVRLVGIRLITKALEEDCGELKQHLRSAQWRSLELEVQAQRLFSETAIPNALFALAEDYWSGQEKAAWGVTLDKNAMCELLRKWQQVNERTELVRDRLTVLVGVESLPGQCPECAPSNRKRS